ncbi:hypothetical protein [Nocardia sp. NBC_01329]|nr:hypothetical protein OG405_12115 [Nocardia sp. NBC_01329]
MHSACRAGAGPTSVKKVILRQFVPASITDHTAGESIAALL